jgi:hypothetical protein
LDRNLYYTTYFDNPITTEVLSEALQKYINNALLYESFMFQTLFGAISRLRYWDDNFYRSKFDEIIKEKILPLVRTKIRALTDQRHIALIEHSIARIIESNSPVIQFTKEEKEQLNETHPIVFLSKKAATETTPKEFSGETGETYVNHLLMVDVDVIYTTQKGCDYVKQQMALFGNRHVKVICNDALFKDADRLPALPGPLGPSRKEIAAGQKRWKEWTQAAPFWNNFKDDLKLSKLNAAFDIRDFQGSTVEELWSFLKDFGFTMTSEQAAQFLDYVNKL